MAELAGALVLLWLGYIYGKSVGAREGIAQGESATIAGTSKAMWAHQLDLAEEGRQAMATTKLLTDLHAQRIEEVGEEAPTEQIIVEAMLLDGLKIHWLGEAKTLTSLAKLSGQYASVGAADDEKRKQTREQLGKGLDRIIDNTRAMTASYVEGFINNAIKARGISTETRERAELAAREIHQKATELSAREAEARARD